MLMKTDHLGIPRFTKRDLLDMIYSGHADKVHVVLCDANDDIDKFNEAMKSEGRPELKTYIPIDVDQKTFDGVCQGEWFMPQEYKELDVYSFVMNKAGDDLAELERVEEELAQFKVRGMNNLLRYMIYLVDFMRENGIVWGVGRGSSVASYVLYLIGVHRINSIQFDLDWREFLR